MESAPPSPCQTSDGSRRRSTEDEADLSRPSTRQRRAADEEEPETVVSWEGIECFTPHLITVDMAYQDGDDKAWPDEERLATFMFKHCRNPTLLRLWTDHTRPALVALLSDALDGVVAVAELVAEWYEPTAEEMCHAWRPRLERLGRRGSEEKEGQPPVSTEEMDTDAVRCSHYGGLPYLRADEQWPIEGMGQYADLVLQLRLSDLPADLGLVYALPDIPLRDQLVQVWGGGGDYVHPHCRLIDSSPLAQRTVTAPAGVTVHPERRLLGWSTKSYRAYPSPSQWRSAGVRVPVNAPLRRSESFMCGLEDCGRYAPSSDDHLCGWGINDGSYDVQHCAQCQTEMQLLMQIDSGSVGFLAFGWNVPLVIHQCPHHRQHLKMTMPVEID